MNWEVYDYRKQKKPELGPWLTYHVPAPLGFDYITKLFIYTYLLPWLFGMSLNVYGILFTTIVFDYIYYRYLKYIIS